MNAKLLFVALVTTIALSVPAEAHRHHYRPHPIHRGMDRLPAVARSELFQTNSSYTADDEDSRYERPQHRTGSGGVVGGRHAGDPHAFCGAEAARYVFGVAKRDLWLAANWIRKFPRTSPAPGMAAARNHHVMILMSHVEGSNWLVHDGNSGRGLTREHVRSIAGYVVVNPHGARYASR